MELSVQRHAPTVLVVEDDDSYAEIVRMCLEESSVAHRFIYAANGRIALDYLLAPSDGEPAGERLIPQLVLLDLRMPGMTGFEVLKELRRNPETLRVPVVVLTSSESRADIARAYEHHANGVLVKPMTYDESRTLLRCVASYWLRHNQSPC